MDQAALSGDQKVGGPRRYFTVYQQDLLKYILLYNDVCAIFLKNQRSKYIDIQTQICIFPFFRFDYSGVGNSDGNLQECTVGRWRKDVLSIIDELAEGPQVTVFVKYDVIVDDNLMIFLFFFRYENLFKCLTTNFDI